MVPPQAGGTPSGTAGPLSAIIWGPPGTGKTTLAHLVASASNRRFVQLSAVTAGVKDVREVMDQARRERDLHDRQTVLFLDEIHGFTKAQQDGLLPGVENSAVLVAATTENLSFSVIAPLLSARCSSRSNHFDEEIREVVDAAVVDEQGPAGGFTHAETPASTSSGSPVATPGGRSTRSRPRPSVAPTDLGSPCRRHRHPPP